jgi:hypothetical protein
LRPVWAQSRYDILGIPATIFKMGDQQLDEFHVEPGTGAHSIDDEGHVG